jgi:hypothetical protein
MMFSQPDTVVSIPDSSMGFNRYAYSNNNPNKYTDPSGHKACSINDEGICDSTEEELIKLMDWIDKLVSMQSVDKDNDGYSETPDKTAEPVEATTRSINCAQTTYTECFYSRSLLSINGKLQFNKRQMASLIVAIYFDINKRDRNALDRMNYDTPIWDGYGSAPGNLCIGDSCYKRQEVNYFAQGMYAAANNEPQVAGLATVYLWKWFAHNKEIPSKEVILWFKMGYMFHQEISGVGQ